MSGIHVIAAELSGRFTGKPRMTLREMMIEASSRAIRSAGVEAREIDALYCGAMGSFEPEGFVGPIPIRLANALGLRHTDVTPMQVGSSEAGAWVLRQAYEGMRNSTRGTVLVVAGEQMNRLDDGTKVPPAERLAERIARNRAIAEILDDSERRYGLNMVRMGDLTMDALRTAEGFDEAGLHDVLLPLIATEKYRRVTAFPMAHLHHKPDLALDDYFAARAVTRYFNMHDVSATSSGAVALILTRRPQRPSLEILGMGQAFAHQSLIGREGDPRHSSSVRSALLRACDDAGVGLRWLKQCDFSLLHDAFVSIEYTFLKELGFSPAEILDRATSGWSNPFGGLKTCGHALGASGLLQIAKAFHRVFNDSDYIAAPFRGTLPPAERCFATSVGGPLTNVVVTLMRKSGTEAEAVDGRPDDLAAFAERTDAITAEFEAVRQQIPTGLALTLAGTQIRHSAAFGDDANPLLQAHQNPWVHLVENAPDSADALPKAYGFSDAEIPPGTLVKQVPVRIGAVVYTRLEPTGERLVLEPRLSPQGWQALVDDAQRKLSSD